MILKKAKMKFTRNHVRVSAGIFLTLLSVFVLLNYGFVSTAIVYAFAFLFGNLYFVPFAILMLFGIKLILLNKIQFLKKNFMLLGLVILFIGILMIISLYSQNMEVSGYDLRLDNFSSTFLSGLQYKGNEPIDVFSAKIGGGYIGFFLVALFNTMFNHYAGSIVFFVLFILVGLFFVMFKFIKQWIRKAKGLAVIEQEVSEEQVQEETEKADKKEEKKVEEKREIEIETEEIPSEFIIPVPNPTLEGEMKPSDTQIIEVPEPEERDLVKTPKISSDDFKAFPDDAFYFGPEKDKPDIFEDKPQEEETVDKVEEIKETVEPDAFVDDMFDEEITTVKNEEIKTVNVDKIDTFEPEIIDEKVEEEPQKEVIEEPQNNISFNNNQSDSLVFNNDISDEEDDNSIIREAFKDVNEVEVKSYHLPYRSLFEAVENDPEIRVNNKLINDKNLARINEFFEQNKIDARAVEYKQGPAVTVFYIEISVKVSTNVVSGRITELSRFLYGVEINFVETIPGKPYSALEIRNAKSEIVSYIEVFEKLKAMRDFNPNSFVYGVSFDGTVKTGSLLKTPHFLVCGITGSGKSVFEHNILLSLLINNSPEDLRLLLIDPKKVELSSYDKIPHLLCPPIIDSKKARNALKKVAEIMENRFEIFNRTHCKKFDSYNKYCEENGYKKMPRIVVLIDEYANLKEEVDGVETIILKLASMSRAAGISLILVTQRPSANLLSPSIKANMASRVCFKTSDSTNSRIILDEVGAEKLAGHGDMLVSDANLGVGLIRLQGPFISDEDVDSVTRYLIQHYKTFYDDNFMNLEDEEIVSPLGYTETEDDSKKEDALLEDITAFIFNSNFDYISQSLLIKNYGIGTGRAGKICVQLQRKGILDITAVPTKGYKVLIRSQAELDDYNNEKLLNEQQNKSE